MNGDSNAMVNCMEEITLMDCIIRFYIWYQCYDMLYLFMITCLGIQCSAILLDCTQILDSMNELIYDSCVRCISYVLCLLL